MWCCSALRYLRVQSYVPPPGAPRDVGFVEDFGLCLGLVLVSFWSPPPSGCNFLLLFQVLSLEASCLLPKVLLTGRELDTR